MQMKKVCQIIPPSQLVLFFALSLPVGMPWERCASTFSGELLELPTKEQSRECQLARLSPALGRPVQARAGNLAGQQD